MDNSEKKIEGLDNNDQSIICEDSDMEINENNEVLIDEEKYADIIINLSSDYYEAFISIHSEDDEFKLEKEEIINALNKKNVTFGLNHDVIDDLVENPRRVDNLSIALGEKHENGIDGKIEYLFDVNQKKKPKMLSDGTVDHKDISYILQANKGELLAKKILPIPGKDGKTVTNRVIKGKNGKPAEFKVGKNVTISNDGMLLLASETGMIKYKDKKVSIIKVLEINEDVGVATGNIIFDGKVIIKGNIETGYIVQSGDDIEIFGIVEGAQIIGKNIIIHKGVHNSGKLFAEGNITAQFMESCYAEAKGDIVCDAIIHCNIKCMGRVIATNKKGLILGGNLLVRKEIIANIIGSQIGSITRLQLGIDEEFMDEIKIIKTELEETNSNLKKINQAIDMLQAKRSNDPKKEIFLNKYLKAKQEHISKAKTLEIKMKDLYKIAEELKDSKLSGKHIHPGTNIRINNLHYIVKNELINSTLLKENGEVVISPNFKRS